jgi:transposase, IS5 family
MLRDRHAIDKVFEHILPLVPRMDPVLAKIDQILEDESLFRLIRDDLGRRYRWTWITGRNSTPVEVILRMLIIKRLYGYSYEETERVVSDSLILRQFCRVYLNVVPDDTTLIKWANVVKPETLEKFNGRITELAIQLKVTEGRKLRTDGTAVETNIHPPSDSRQLADSVRVLARSMERARGVLEQMGESNLETFQNYTRAAKAKAHQISETLRKRTAQAKEAGQQVYAELIEMTQQTVKEAQQTAGHLERRTEKTAQRLARTLRTFIPLAEKVVKQTQRRIIQKEDIPASEKLVSLFEPHTDIIVRGKENHPVEYGHKVWLNEVDGGIVNHYRVLKGNPHDNLQWVPSLQAHIQTFKKPPEQASADRALYSQANEQAAQELGVEKIILPKGGYRSQKRRQFENQEWFISGRCWHAGVEGRISVLKRAHGLRRCLDHGSPGFERWVGWGIIVGNLKVIGRA